MASSNEISAVFMEICTQYPYRSETREEVLCEAVADARNERDALQAAVDRVRYGCTRFKIVNNIAQCAADGYWMATADVLSALGGAP